MSGKGDSAVSVDKLLKSTLRLQESFAKNIKELVGPGMLLVTTPESLTGRPAGDMVLVQANDAKDPKAPGKPASDFQTQSAK
jgi:hypothetical protein